MLQAPQAGEWIATRVVHLHGGLRAVNDRSSQVGLSPRIRARGVRPTELQLRGYGQLFLALIHDGFSIVGCDFASTDDERSNLQPHQWFIFGEFPKVWICRQMEMQWDGIAHAAALSQHAGISDVATRVKHHLRVCAWRVRQLSNTYHDLLIAHVGRGSGEWGKWFLDEYSWRVYAELAAFLVDACILRDRLAEFAVAHIFGRTQDCPTTMGSLVKMLSRSTMGSSDALARHILDDCKGAGWLASLGSYRDLVVHAAPLLSAAGHMYCLVDTVETKTFGLVPVAHCPLPPNPADVKKARARGSVPDPWDGAGTKFADSGKGLAAGVDGLRYAHSTLLRLYGLSNRLIERSPVKPVTPTFRLPRGFKPKLGESFTTTFRRPP